jgi:hypothetical protein
VEDILRKALDTGISFHRGLFEEPGGNLLAGTFLEKRKLYLGSLLGPRGH